MENLRVNLKNCWKHVFPIFNFTWRRTAVWVLFLKEFSFLIYINHQDELRFRGESVCSECCLLMINVCFWQTINQLNSHIDNFNFNVTCHSINHSYGTPAILDFKILFSTILSKFWMDFWGYEESNVAKRNMMKKEIDT